MKYQNYLCLEVHQSKLYRMGYQHVTHLFLDFSLKERIYLAFEVPRHFVIVIQVYCSVNKWRNYFHLIIIDSITKKDTTFF